MNNTAGREGAVDTAHETTRQQAEVVIVEIFTTLLGDDANRETDFFDAGGDSILAARVIARLRQSLAARVSMRDLFQARTPAALALAIVGRTPVSR